MSITDIRYNLVQAVVKRHDPLGLLAKGRPLEQYDSEITAIMPKIGLAMCVEDLHEYVYFVFANKLFCIKSKNGAEHPMNVVVGRKEDYRQLAEQLFHLREFFYS